MDQIRWQAYKVVDLVLRIILRLLPPSNFTEKIALSWGYRFQPKPGLVKLRSGAFIQTERIDHQQLLLYYTGTFEPHCLKVMTDYLRPGDTLLDVGANIGLFSIEGAKRIGPSGKVISIEASPHHAKMIKSSAALNGIQDVIEVFSCAAGDALGSATLTLPRNGNGGMFTLGDVEGDEQMDVTVRLIDEIVEGLKIDFIKIDIEGSEYRALLGAHRVVSRFHPPILIELNDRALAACGSSSQKVKELLFSHGYRGTVIASGRPISLWDRHCCDECLFIA